MVEELNQFFKRSIDSGKEEEKMVEELNQSIVSTINELSKVLTPGEIETVEDLGRGFIFVSMLKLYRDQDEESLSDKDAAALKWLESDEVSKLSDDPEQAWNDMPQEIRDWFYNNINEWYNTIVGIVNKIEKIEEKEEI